MEAKTLTKLEYDKIIALLAEHCGFAVSREQAQALQDVYKRQGYDQPGS